MILYRSCIVLGFMFRFLILLKLIFINGTRLKVWHHSFCMWIGFPSSIWWRDSLCPLRYSLRAPSGYHLVVGGKVSPEFCSVTRSVSLFHVSVAVELWGEGGSTSGYTLEKDVLSLCWNCAPSTNCSVKDRVQPPPVSSGLNMFHLLVCACMHTLSHTVLEDKFVESSFFHLYGTSGYLTQFLPNL